MNYNNKNKNLCKKWELVNFCEFDKYAEKSYCAIHNVNPSKNLGDITKVDENNLSPFNMICGGSPCQDFSVAGKQKGSIWTCKDCGHEYNPLTVHWSERDKCPHCGSTNLEKTRSSLLVEYLRVIRANKPNFGIYENVKNIVGKQFKETTFKLFTDELEEYGYNVYWKVLNAKHYGIPQNRERVYLIFIKKELDNGLFKFPEPFDNGTRLKDILEDKVDEKYYISEEKVKKFIKNIHTYESNTSNEQHFIGNINRPDFGIGYAGGVWDKNNISHTLTTMQGGGRQPHIMIGIDKSFNDTKIIDIANCLTAREDRGISNRKSEDTAVIEKLEIPDTSYCINANYYKGTTIEHYVEKHKRQLISNVDKISQPDDKIICASRGRNPENPSDRTIGAPTEQRLEFNHNGCTNTLTSVQKDNYVFETNNIRIRKLTPRECFRLMGFSDNAFDAAEEVVSNTQLYKQAGNSIVVDVLYYIFVELYKAMPYLFDNLKLSSFFSGIGAFECALDRLYKNINNGNFIHPQVD